MNKSKITILVLTGAICTSIVSPTVTAFASQKNSTVNSAMSQIISSDVVNLKSIDLSKSETIELNKAIELMKNDYNSQVSSEYGIVGKINNALKTIIKYVNYLPTRVKEVVMRFLGPLQNLVNTVEITSISMLKKLLLDMGMWEWAAELICDVVRMIIF